MDHLDSIQVTYVSGIIHGRATEILVPNVRHGFDSRGDNIFFYNLVIMYWTLNSTYMQFEYRFPRSNTVSGRACAVT